MGGIRPGRHRRSPPARAGGRPRYTAWKLAALALDGVCSFSVVPLRAAAITGMLAIGACVVFALYAVYMRVFAGTVPVGFTASLLVTTFLSGVQLLFLGVIGEYPRQDLRRGERPSVVTSWPKSWAAADG